MTRVVLNVSRLMALIGGFILALIILITCVSILGRTLNSGLHSDLVQGVVPGIANWLIEIGIGPIKGDFELVESLMAFSIFAFLPLTQMTNGHASVDIFTAWLPRAAQRYLRFLIELLFAAALLVIAYQLYVGTLSKMRSGQTTFLLEYPIWWAYAASVVGAVIAALVGVYVALLRGIEVVTGHSLVLEEHGADH